MALVLPGDIVEFQLLGAVQVYVAGRPVHPGPPQQRLVVAALAADAGRPVTPEVLIERVWDEPTAGSRRILHVVLSRIRKLIDEASASGPAPARVVRRAGGYVLDVEPDRVDIHRFRRLAGEAGRRDLAPDRRVELLRQALAGWQGEPLAGLPGRWAAQTREGWRRLRLDTAIAWAQAEIGVANAAAAIEPITELVAANPFDESLLAVLMQAMAAAGRRADALLEYDRGRRRLADELGIDPGPALRAVHQTILREGLGAAA